MTNPYQRAMEPAGIGPDEARRALRLAARALRTGVKDAELAEAMELLADEITKAVVRAATENE